jgi:hypothetical protein
MSRRDIISYQTIPVVKNVLFEKQLKIIVPNKFKKLLVSIGFLMVVSLVFWIFSLIAGETAAARTIEFNNLNNLSYRFIDVNGSITNLKAADKIYEQLKIGNVISSFPVSSKSDKVQWIENLLKEEETLQSLKMDEEKQKIISILENEERAEYVIKYSEEYKIPVYLVIGVIFAESSNKAYAVSKVGARGLMQLMPDTAVLIARKKGMAKTAMQIRKDVEFLNKNENINIQFGCTHLRDLYNKIGTWKGAVHSYNQGYARYMKGHRSDKYVSNVFKYWNYFENLDY